MLINRNQIASLLKTGLASVFGQLPVYPEQWKEIYKTYKSEKSQEEDIEMRFLGPADIKEEGAPYATDTMKESIKTTYQHRNFGLAFQITKEAIEDNLYQSQFPQQALSLKNSLHVTKNMMGANILNNAFNTAYPIGDGQPLCSTMHPIDGGTYANRLTGAGVALSEAALEPLLVGIQKFVMQSGILAQTMARKLIIPPERQFDAIRILNSSYRTDTGNNDVNAIYNKGYFPEGFAVNQYLASPTAYFILTDSPDGFKHYQRKPVETDVYVDFTTDNLLAKASERYSFGVSNPRAVWGDQGA